MENNSWSFHLRYIAVIYSINKYIESKRMGDRSQITFKLPFSDKTSLLSLKLSYVQAESL